MGQEFCDAAWRRGIAGFGKGPGLDSLPSGARYAALRDAGVLSRYYRALEDEVAARAAALRDRILKERRGVFFAVLLPPPPARRLSPGHNRRVWVAAPPPLPFSPRVLHRPTRCLCP